MKKHVYICISLFVVSSINAMEQALKAQETSEYETVHAIGIYCSKKELFDFHLDKKYHDNPIITDYLDEVATNSNRIILTKSLSVKNICDRIEFIEETIIKQDILNSSKVILVLLSKKSLPHTKKRFRFLRT